ncbi:transposase [Dorea sp. D27]|uniref:transposase n=1 Tax=Dorea sp. D27 TaxID=658665 RepID=UPI0006731322|nr:transposase [Dorea sp. D27]KMZ54945.1 hypothetical protein HMPREF0980_00941 [Dorea sp. D27]
MPRKPRMRSSTDMYHITNRGINKNNIFNLENDKKKFLRILQKSCLQYPAELYSYCIMSNHFHLLLKIPFTELSAFIQQLSTTYAVYYNSKYNKSGHVFQGRFHSEAIQNEKYFWCCMRYIHNNPMQACLVPSPVMYKFSSMREYVKKSRFLIHPKAFRIYVQHFPNTIDFQQFHNKHDRFIYIDTPEEVYERKKLLIEKCSKYFLAGKNLPSEDAIFWSSELKKEFIKYASDNLDVSKAEVGRYVKF